MAMDIQRSLDFGGIRRLLNLPDPIGDQEPATKAYVLANVEGLAWKASVRVATVSNVNLASPGAALDGVTLSATNRVLVTTQTLPAQNGIYIWNGPTTAMTRSLDANTADELKMAIVPVREGTSAGTSYKQDNVINAVDVDPIAWSSFGSSAGPASTSSAGLIQIATQPEVDAGTASNKAITPAGLKNSPYAVRKIGQDIGDGSATSYTVTHAMNTRDVTVEVYRNSGSYDTVFVEVQRPSVNSVDILFDTAPSSNAYRVVVRG